MTRITDEYRKLQPLIVAEIRAALQGLSLSSAGGGGAAPDLTGYLTQTAGDARYLKLGGGTMTGNIGMPALGTVDGVDMSVHILDPDAHHARRHGILTAADHSMIGNALDLVGLTGTDTLGKLTPSSAPGATAKILATDSSGVLRLTKFEIGSTPAFTLYGTNNVGTNPDIDADTSFEVSAQSSQYFNIDSNDSSTAQAFVFGTNRRINSGGTELMRLTESGRLGIGDSTPSYELDVAGTIQGQTAVRSPALVATTDVTTPLIVTASGNLTVTPAGTSVILSDGKAYTSVSFAGGFTGNGFRIDQGIATAGKTTAEFDNLVVRGRMSVYELLIRQIRATNGAVFVTSTAKVTGVTGPSAGIYTLTTDEETPHGFLVNDVIRAQRTKWDGSTLVGIYQSDMIVTGSVNLYTFRATLETGSDAPEAGYEYVRLGNTGNADRRGTVYLTADDTNAPYIDIVDGVASHADWNTAGKIKGRFGKLTGITSVTNEYGLMVGNGFASTDKYIKASTEGVLLNKVDIQLRSGATQTGNIASDGTFWFGVSSADKRLKWDGTTLAISGEITATTGTIAGWTIGATEIENSTGYLHLVSGGAGTARIEVGDQTTAGRGAGIVSRSTASGIVFWAGEPFDSDLSTAPFTVTSAGALKADSATLTGSFTAGNVSITPTDAMTVGVGATHADNSSIRFMRGGVKEGQISAYTGYMTVNANGVLFLYGGSGVYVNAVLNTAGDIGAGSDVWVDRIRGNETTAYLAAQDGSNVLSWTNAAITAAVDVTAPALRVASGTGYLKVGSSNVVTWSTSVFQTTADLGAASWTALTFNDEWPATRSGTVYAKKFGDQVFLRGSAKSTGTSGTYKCVDLPAGYARMSSTITIYLPRSNAAMIKAQIVGDGAGAGYIELTSYTSGQDIFFDNASFFIS